MSYHEKPEVYRAFGNGVLARAVLDHLPAGGSLLDVGCASGGLLAIARGRAGHLVGLEISETAAREAAAVGDVIIRGALEDDDLPIDRDAFDVVACADVLEHTVEPAVGLRRAVAWSKPGGHVVISVPNIAHWSARLRLLTGRWYYEPSGIFDSGHLRFFTPATLEELVRSVGLDITRTEVVVPALRNIVPSLSRMSPRVRRRIEGWWQRVGARRPALFGFQIVVVARRPG